MSDVYPEWDKESIFVCRKPRNAIESIILWFRFKIVFKVYYKLRKRLVYRRIIGKSIPYTGWRMCPVCDVGSLRNEWIIMEMPDEKMYKCPDCKTCIIAADSDFEVW